MYEVLSDEIRELNVVNIECDRDMVQIIAITGMTVLGCVAMLIDGEIGETIAIAVASGMGILVGYLFKKEAVNEVQ